jgi:large subunit ribosomal protein L2
MSLKIYKPTSAGRRGMTSLNYRELLSGHRPTKALVKGGKKTSARNTDGRITTRHHGGGHKKKFRTIDFRFDKKNIPARIASIEYDPHRTAFIGLAVYADGEKRYVVVPQKMSVDDTFIVSETAAVKTGNRLPLSRIPVGTFVYNVALKPDSDGRIARAAGNYVEVVAHDAGYVHVKMPSTEVRKIPANAWASVGEVSNEEQRLVNIGKAGRSRWLGKRPTVRGTAMNPVDHPHGGGEGRQGRGLRRAKSAWGKPTGKGQKSRRPKKYSNVFIVSRRKVGKRK